MARHIAGVLKNSGWAGRGSGLPFYLVGGSWRGLTQWDMHLTRYPLPIVNGYAMSAARIRTLGALLTTASKQDLKAVPNLSSGRIPTLGDAAALLSEVLSGLGCERTVTSSFGLREGLLYQALDPEARREDPLLAAAREEGRRLSRFEEHGDLLNQWIAPLFADEPADLARLRHAACLLADVGWHANPDFRAERGVEIALHGQWVAIDPAGRALVAQALHTALGAEAICRHRSHARPIRDAGYGAAVGARNPAGPTVERRPGSAAQPNASGTRRPCHSPALRAGGCCPVR